MKKNLNNKYTKTPNDIFDNWDYFSFIELKIIGPIIRQNFGFEKENNNFSLSYLMRRTGMSKPSIIKGLKSLKEKKIIIQLKGKGIKNCNLYKYNEKNNISSKRDLPVNNIDRSTSFTTTGKQDLPEVVNDVDTLKEISLKETNIKETIITNSKENLKNTIKSSKPIEELNLELEELISNYQLPSMCAEIKNELIKLMEDEAKKFGQDSLPKRNI